MTQAFSDAGIIPTSGLQFVPWVRNALPIPGENGVPDLATQPAANSLATVSFVSRQLLGTPPPSDADRVHHRLDILALMALASRRFNREGHARAVSNQVELAAPPASAAAQCVVRRLLQDLPLGSTRLD